LFKATEQFLYCQRCKIFLEVFNRKVDSGSLMIHSTVVFMHFIGRYSKYVKLISGEYSVINEHVESAAVNKKQFISAMVVHKRHTPACIVLKRIYMDLLLKYGVHVSHNYTS